MGRHGPQLLNGEARMHKAPIPSGQSTENGADVSVFAWEEAEELKAILRPFLMSCEFP